MFAGAGVIKGVQEVHGHVRHHCQSEGHLQASRRYSTKVSSSFNVQQRFLSFHEPYTDRYTFVAGHLAAVIQWAQCLISNQP